MQSGGTLSADGYKVVPTEGIMTSFNLTGLRPLTNYSILATVNGTGVDNAPFDQEIQEKTNTTSEIS